MITNPDAELIACCDRLIAIDGEMEALDAARIDSTQNPEIDVRCGEIKDLMQRIKKLPDASTSTALHKMSQAALSLALKDDDGSPVFDGNAEWLAWRIARILNAEGCPVTLGLSPTNVDPDAELMSLCSAFHEAHAQLYAIADTESGVAESARDRRCAISAKISNIPARTDAGRFAKAKVAFTVLHESDPEPNAMDSVTLCVYAALRDIVGSAAA